MYVRNRSYVASNANGKPSKAAIGMNAVSRPTAQTSLWRQDANAERMKTRWRANAERMLNPLAGAYAKRHCLTKGMK
ncbi:MAG: hypothetical protein LBK66_05320 [Spirochaetaceae bacterium]|nr:hypothetical protein [Spirochaetaceae bacterium]